MRTLLCLSALLAPPGVPSAGAADFDPVASWQGTLEVGGGASLRLVFHVARAPDGTLSATMDSPDQGAKGMKADAVDLGNDTVSIEFKRLSARFVGKPNADRATITGKWTQGPSSLPLTLKRSTDGPVDDEVKGPEQAWEGTLKVNAGITLRLILRTGKNARGSPVARLDSPDEGLKGLRTDKVALDASRLAFSVNVSGARFDGKLNPQGTEAVGAWSQRGQSLPLTFRKTEKPSEARRPQTPRPPFPYSAEAVSYTNGTGEAAVTLAGTLTTPPGKGPFPAVVLISGSGAQDRDETIFQHRPFLVLADALTRRGVAVLRVDDRGVGGSSGSTGRSTSDDFAGDVLAGVRFLKQRSGVNPKAIGLIGHSEGGIIAPMAAARSDDVAFIVLLAGTALPGDEIVVAQSRLIGRAMGLDAKALDRQVDAQKRLFAAMRKGADPKARAAEARRLIREALNDLPAAERKEAGDSEAVIDAQLAALESPWFRFFLTYDPRPTLANVRCPVLALVGEKDLQVPPAENLGEIARVLKEAGNRDVTVKILPGLNHLFQTCQTGAPSEYARIEETFAPSALTTVVDWVVERAARR